MTADSDPDLSNKKYQIQNEQWIFKFRFARLARVLTRTGRGLRNLNRSTKTELALDSIALFKQGQGWTNIAKDVVSKILKIFEYFINSLKFS